MRLSKSQFGSGTGGVIPLKRLEVAIRIEGQLATGDVNRDGQVSILDMILIARHLGETQVDVNGDGIVNVLDLVILANAFGKDAPDVNGDGTVNVLDLLAVANAFE